VNGFDYIRNRNAYYVARTPRAALLAIKENAAPLESFVYKSLSAKPLFEEPYDLEDLERVLADPGLDLGDAMLLAEIFSEMTRGRDKEVALFAAESLGSLEGRWSRKIEELRPSGAAADQACEDESIFEYARALYEYALIAGRYSTIRNYYLREAFYQLDRHPAACASAEGFDLRIRCLLRLGLVDQAESIIASELGRRDDGELLALAVEAAFCRKDPRRVRELLAGRDLGELDVDPEVAELLRGWTA